MATGSAIKRGLLIPALCAAAVVGLIPPCLAVRHNPLGVGTLIAFMALSIGAGLVLWRVPGQRVNALHLVLVGAASGLGPLTGMPLWPWGYNMQIGFAFEWLMAPLLVRVLLSYPGPHIARGSGRRLLWTAWAWAAGLRLVSSLFWNPVHAGTSPPTGQRWITLIDAPWVADRLGDLADAVGVVLAVWTAREMWVRRARRGPPAARPGWSRLPTLAGVEDDGFTGVPGPQVGAPLRKHRKRCPPLHPPVRREPIQWAWGCAV